VTKFGELTSALEDAHEMCWWIVDPPLKYLKFSVDTRSCGFALCDRDSNPIEPERVHAAIKKYRQVYGDLRQSAQSNEEHRDG